MVLKNYGKTGKKVSALGFGAMRFRKEEYEKDPEISAEVVRYALDKGINYFDTAPGYCHDMSETILGLAFKGRPREEFFISSKSSYWSDKTADDVRRRCETSLKRLNVDSIDFYHMWSIMNLPHYKNVMAPGGPYEGALKLKEEGLIKHLCLSTHAAGHEIEEIIGDGAFEGILLGYNALNFLYRRQGILSAHAKGMGVVTMNPLGGGIIPQCPDYFSFLKEDELTLVQSALKFNISHKEISVTLSGMGTKEEIDENIEAAKVFEEISEQKLEGLTETLSVSLNALCTGCGYCEPCPEGILIPRMMDAYNMKILTDKDQAIKDRLRYHWDLKPETADLCTQCGHCEAHCTQHLPIIERLAEIADL